MVSNKALYGKTPRMWGWTDTKRADLVKRFENPTYVGMDLKLILRDCLRQRKPHVCGDGPPVRRPGASASAKTPRMWGWTSGAGWISLDYTRKPHVCGDGPPVDIAKELGVQKTPRMWGWTGQRAGEEAVLLRKPHVCGDGPATRIAYNDAGEKTPRMWGWTDQEQNNPGGPIENPTYVGMDRLSEWHGRSLARKPHVCGDGPTICHQQGEKLEKTPRMWGWTAPYSPFLL